MRKLAPSALAVSFNCHCCFYCCSPMICLFFLLLLLLFLAAVPPGRLSRNRFLPASVPLAVFFGSLSSCVLDLRFGRLLNNPLRLGLFLFLFRLVPPLAVAPLGRPLWVVHFPYFFPWSFPHRSLPPPSPLGLLLPPNTAGAPKESKIWAL